MPFHGTIWYRRKKYYKIHKCKQKIEDREVLMFIYVSYLKEIKQHMRVWPKYTFISIWSQYLLIQIRKWIYVTTFKTTFFLLKWNVEEWYVWGEKVYCHIFAKGNTITRIKIGFYVVFYLSEMANRIKVLRATTRQYDCLEHI